MGLEQRTKAVFHGQVLYGSFSGSLPVYFSGSLPRSKIPEFKFWYRVYVEKRYSLSVEDPQTGTLKLFEWKRYYSFPKILERWEGTHFLNLQKSQGGYHYWTNSTSDPNKTESPVGRDYISLVFFIAAQCWDWMRILQLKKRWYMSLWALIMMII